MLKACLYSQVIRLYESDDRTARLIIWAARWKTVWWYGLLLGCGLVASGFIAALYSTAIATTLAVVLLLVAAVQLTIIHALRHNGWSTPIH